MFVKYFNLAEQPFGATPDPRFLFQSPSHREALASLYCAFYASRGFTALIAQPGMGKTTLLFEFLEHIKGRAKTIFLFNTFCGPDDIVLHLLRDSGIEPESTIAGRYQQINDMLAREAEAGRPVVLVIDEAQNLSSHTLEGIRLLTNFETSRSKLMQVVLAGQPQLAERLARPELAQLRQRISTICRIAPFSTSETRAYIEHRLKIAGCGGRPLFTPKALDSIAAASAGIPRVINTLCFNSLCLCRARGSKQVDPTMVREAIKDLELAEHSCASAQSMRNAAQSSQRQLSRGYDFHALKRVVYASTALLALCGAITGSYLWRAHSTLRPELSIHQAANTSSNAPATRQRSTEQSPAATTPHQHEQAARAASQATGSINVRVAEGDTLIGIATSYLGSSNQAVVREIQALNPRLTDPNHIETGRTISLPKPDQLTVPHMTTRNEP